MKKGKCYGVSVGPGDSKLMTLKALEIVKEVDCIFLPSSPKEECKVYKIIKDAIKDLEEDKFICIETKGMADHSLQGDRYDMLAEKVKSILDEGKSVAFLALGEVCLYSTYMYVYERISKDGYDCENISGVSSVQETANRFLISLAQGDEQIHVFPDTKNLSERLKMPGTKVFMKPKGNLSETILEIKKYVYEHPDVNAYGISNCGTDLEILAKNIEDFDKLAGYMTVIIVK